jgi:hypothetical protein
MKEFTINLSELKNLKVEYFKNEYVVTLIDDHNYEILKGYGLSITDAINDLFRSLI